MTKPPHGQKKTGNPVDCGKNASLPADDWNLPRLHQAFEQAPGFICILRGPDHVFEFVNSTHRKLFGSDDWIGKPARDAFRTLPVKDSLNCLIRLTGLVNKFRTPQLRRVIGGPRAAR